MKLELNEVNPDYISAPGDTLKEVITSKGLTQNEVAARLGTSPKNLSGLINNKVAITPAMAVKLEYVLGVPATFWNNLMKNYQEFTENHKQDKRNLDQTEWLRNFDYADLAKKNFVPKTRKASEKVKFLLKFFGYSDFEFMQKDLSKDSILAGAYRLTTKQGPINTWSLTAWIQEGDIRAAAIQTQDFSKTRLKRAIPEIRSLVSDDDPKMFLPILKKQLANSGVALVFVPEVKGCRVSGVTRWKNHKKVIVELSLRYKSNDQLWFTLFHELAHLLLHEQAGFFISADSYEKDEREKQADHWAANTLIPDKDWRSFAAKQHFSKPDIIDFAKQVDIHPGIVVGRLQKEEFIPYNRFNDLKIRYDWKN